MRTSVGFMEFLFLIKNVAMQNEQKRKKNLKNIFLIQKGRIRRKYKYFLKNFKKKVKTFIKIKFIEIIKHKWCMKYPLKSQVSDESSLNCI